MAISFIVLAIFFVIIAGSVIFVFVSIIFMTISAIARCSVSAMAISVLTLSISTIAMSAISMSVAFTIASIAVAIQMRVIADRCVMWSKFMEVIEGSNDMRSIKSMGKFHFRWARFVKHLNGDVFFTTSVQFFCTRHCITFRFDGYTFLR